MKVKGLLVVLVILVNTNLFAMEKGEELFREKCGACHLMLPPNDKTNMLAPPLLGTMYHLREQLENDEEVYKHIISFTMNPTKETALHPSVRRFPIMLSERENVTDEELEIIAKWMIEVQQ